jgi:YbbR domain-containing protein
MRESEQRNKWVVRIFAFLTACALWLYVMNEQNPVIERSFTVPLTKTNLAENMVVNNIPETVIVKVKGTRTVISSAREKDILAYIDFSNATKGRHGFDIMAKSTVGDIVEVSPKTIFLDLDTISERTMDVEARIVGIPGSGVTVGKLELDPVKVTVSGASNRLANALKVIALVDITGKDKNFEDYANLTAIAIDGSEMYDLNVQPNKVQIKALMLKQLVTIELPVKPVMSGVLKKGYTISVVKTVPEKVKLTADPAVLAGLSEIKTAPILLDNIEDDVEMQMPLNLPDKVLAETHSVLVKIQLEKPR